MSSKAIFLKGMLVLAIMLAISFAVGSAQASKTGSGFVYVMTNQPSGNTVIQYQRASNGLLTQTAMASTDGLGGTGNGVGALDPLGSQDSLVLSGDGTRLLAVNAGSNELSALGAGDNGLTLLSKVASGGEFPNSVALSGDLVYVLNAHGTPNVTGFRLDAMGVLHPIAGSTHALPGGTSAAPHDVVFSPDGSRLLVTEGGTNQIDIFAVGDDGLLSGVSTQASPGGPFGLRFGRNDIVAVAEASAGALSTYQLTSEDTLIAISSSVPDGQKASCWLSMTRNGHTFVSNTGSGNLSSYQVGADGTAALAEAIAVSIAPGAPIDSALASNSSLLYVDDSAGGRIFIFGVHGNSLAGIGSVNGLPTTLQGIAAQ
ncbi:MAG TPA: beta-propeller fold lactonase family protein [Terriglobales bacterium]|nr:beta-propeller fold lactonase family protein [Terriglobales bacterium]